MEIEIVFHLAVAAVNLVVGVYVLAKNPRGIVHRSFFIFTLGIFLWSFSMFLLYRTHTPWLIAPTLWGSEITLLGFVLLAEVFPDQKSLKKISLLFLAPLVLLALLTPTERFIVSVDFSHRGYLKPENGPWFPLFVVVIAAYVAWSFWKFFRRYRRLGGVRRVQMAYLLMGAGIFIAAALVFDVFLPAFHIFTFNLLGPIFSAAFVMCTAYAIVRHRLLDIEFVVKRGATYALTLGTIAALFFTLEFVVERFLYYDELVDIAAGMVGGLLFSRIRRMFEAFTDHFFFRKDYDYGRAVQDLGERLNRASDLETLVQSIDQFLMKTVKPRRVAFYIRDANAATFHREVFHGAVHPSSDRRDAYRDLFKELAGDFAKPIFVEEQLERDGHGSRAMVLDMAGRLDLVAFVPLGASEGIRGAIFLGKKLSDGVLGSKDRALLMVLAHQAGMAFENLRFAEEAARFKHAQESQSKFLTDIAHELQTPVAILRANVEVAGGRQSGDRRESLRVMGMTLDRMTQMVTNLLAVSRLNFSKEKLHTMPVNVQTMLEEIYGDCVLLAEEKGVVLSFSSEPVMVAGDRDKLKEVILNLVSNALKHTPRGGSITLQAMAIEKMIAISVVDTGSGIPAENLPHVFERFYRIDGVGPGGTGLGLNICRQIVEAHGGLIRAESEVGRGSVFTVLLPPHVDPREEEK